MEKADKMGEKITS